MKVRCIRMEKQSSIDKGLTPDDINALICSHQEKGDQEAQPRLGGHYRKLKERLAYRNPKGKRQQEDLVQVGRVAGLGQINGFEAPFDPTCERFLLPPAVAAP